MEQQELWIRSALDASMQPSLFYRNTNPGKHPLLVGLHTWSYDRFGEITKLLPFAEKLGFHLLLPEFRGSNTASNPACKFACGSQYAKQDIQDVIDHIRDLEYVDEKNIFLLGASGGGHMALLIAGMIPEYFKAIAAYVPITDLAIWAKQNDYYRPHILACCGEDEKEMLSRSPIHYIDTIAKANLKIFHGKYDPSVPCSQSLDLYNLIVCKHPSASVYLDIFDGGHQLDLNTAEYWFTSQYQKNDLLQVSK